MNRNILVSTRPLAPSDSQDVARIIVAAAGRAYAFFGWNYSLRDIVEWLEENPSQWTEQWIAEAGGQPVAFMAMRHGFIDQLFVFPHWQGYGIGGRLIRLAKRRFPAGLALNCAQQNFPAIAFYRRQGFIAVSYHMQQPENVDAIIFRWNGS
jgi:ribosomal protein S18 acetylase RimI-like enzyme